MRTPHLDARPLARVAPVRVGLVGCVMALAACSNAPSQPAEQVPDSIVLTSPRFSSGSRIPDAYTCRGKNISPELVWQALPEGTAELALIMEDTTAGGAAHWVVYGIPPGVEEVGLDGVPEGAIEGTNDHGAVGYRGPCPARDGTTHEYEFTIYALRTKLALEPGAAKRDLMELLDGRAMAKGTLLGTYGRN